MASSRLAMLRFLSRANVVDLGNGAHQCRRALSSVGGFYDKQSFLYDDVELFTKEKEWRDRNAEGSRHSHWTSRQQNHVVSDAYRSAVGSPIEGRRSGLKTSCHPVFRHCGQSWANHAQRAQHVSFTNYEQKREICSSAVRMAENGGDGKPAKKLSQKERLKQHMKEHGATGAVLYGGLWVMSLSACYLLVQSGIDVAVLLSKCGFADQVVQSKIAAEATTFAIAYGAHTLVAPARIGLTIAGTPLLVRLRKGSNGA